MVSKGDLLFTWQLAKCRSMAKGKQTDISAERTVSQLSVGDSGQYLHFESFPTTVV